MQSSPAQLTVLVLDDHERIQEIWATLLAAAGMQYIGAASIEAAKEALTSRNVDLVVIDEHLAEPDESGSDFAIWLREAADPRLSRMPILACTSDQSHAIRERLSAAGAGAVIDKPIEVRLALLLIRDLVKQAAASDMRREA
ncbi:MAG: hypothetical protein RIR33_383 [Pseudomonadota bacterium]